MNLEKWGTIWITVQKMKFSIKDFFSQCDQICNFLWIWPHLQKKSLMENFIFYAVDIFSVWCFLSWYAHKSNYSNDLSPMGRSLSQFRNIIPLSLAYLSTVTDKVFGENSSFYVKYHTTERFEFLFSRSLLLLLAKSFFWEWDWALHEILALF